MQTFTDATPLHCCETKHTRTYTLKLLLLCVSFTLITDWQRFGPLSTLLLYAYDWFVMEFGRPSAFILSLYIIFSDEYRPLRTLWVLNIYCELLRVLFYFPFQLNHKLHVLPFFLQLIMV